VRDKWRDKKWYSITSPTYFGEVDLGLVPSDDPEKVVGRVVDSTLYDITSDFAHQYLKMFFQVTDLESKTAHTIFKGHEYSRDYLRSLVRRRTTRAETILNITTIDGYKLRLSICVFTLSRITKSQEQTIRGTAKRIAEERANALTFDQFVQEMVLGKIGSDIYNQIKKISPLRHVGIRKSKLIYRPTVGA
jgi:small subunit ribosomal protein S3Ae